MIFTLSVILAVIMLLSYGIYMVSLAYRDKTAELENRSGPEITDVIPDFYEWEKGDELYVMGKFFGTYQGILDDDRIVIKKKNGDLKTIDPFAKINLNKSHFHSFHGHSSVRLWDVNPYINRSARERKQKKEAEEAKIDLENSRKDEFVETKKKVLRELNGGNRLTNTS